VVKDEFDLLGVAKREIVALIEFAESTELTESPRLWPKCVTLLLLSPPPPKGRPLDTGWSKTVGESRDGVWPNGLPLVFVLLNGFPFLNAVVAYKYAYKYALSA
jgi:hypothetical protein